MSYVMYNPNPDGSKVGDCVIRALSKALNFDWEKTYIEIAVQGFIKHDMPSSNNVWGSYLKEHGYKKYLVPDECPDCYTVREFCNDNPDGIFIVYTDGHLVTIVDGNYYDTFDSGDETVIYYWRKEV